jgi:L-ascorbate metabolism protein UlaG (beta-lactamase superfamily)
MVKQIGDVDVLMIDIGKTGNLDPEKSEEILESIEPRAVIPMGDGDFTASFK